LTPSPDPCLTALPTICSFGQHLQEQLSVYLNSPCVKKLNSNANIINSAWIIRENTRKFFIFNDNK
jgi:hypothetical protein